MCAYITVLCVKDILILCLLCFLCHPYIPHFNMKNFYIYLYTYFYSKALKRKSPLATVMHINNFRVCVHRAGQDHVQAEEGGHEMKDVMQSTESTANLDRRPFQFIAYFSWHIVKRYS